MAPLHRSLVGCEDQFVAVQHEPDRRDVRRTDGRGGRELAGAGAGGQKVERLLSCHLRHGPSLADPRRYRSSSFPPCPSLPSPPRSGSTLTSASASRSMMSAAIRSTCRSVSLSPPSAA